jgi:hypothetical protein
MESDKPISIEHSNTWFFVILASFVVPGVFFLEHDAAWVYVAIFTIWFVVLFPLYLRRHREHVQWVVSLDNDELSALQSNSRRGSYFHRLARAEKKKRDRHLGDLNVS